MLRVRFHTHIFMLHIDIAWYSTDWARWLCALIKSSLKLHWKEQCVFYNYIIVLHAPVSWRGWVTKPAYCILILHCIRAKLYIKIESVTVSVVIYNRLIHAATLYLSNRSIKILTSSYLYTRSYLHNHIAYSYSIIFSNRDIPPDKFT